MKTIRVGFTVLTMQLFPNGWFAKLVTIGGMYNSIFIGISPIWYHIFSIIINLFIAGIIVWVFLSKTQLTSRLPENIPGKNWLIAGIALVVFFLDPRLIASIIQGSGPSFVLMRYAPYFLLAAKVFLIVGAVKVLLSASPTSSTPNNQL